MQKGFVIADQFFSFGAHRRKQLVRLSSERGVLRSSSNAIAIEVDALS
jgi:hypothetical protein